MIISQIVAASENNAIGKNNQLLWKLPNDMRYFKNMTWGMPVIMGRKTYESMNGDPLPGRFNFVITRDNSWKPADPRAQIAHSLDSAIALAKETDCKESFIIGGGEIFKESIMMTDKIYMTRVHAVLDGDAFFPNIDPAQWQLVSNRDFPVDERHAFAYSFQTWQHKS